MIGHPCAILCQISVTIPGMGLNLEYWLTDSAQEHKKAVKAEKTEKRKEKIPKKVKKKLVSSSAKHKH